MGELVKVKIENNIAVVTLDSPPVNALSPALLKELKAEFEALDGNAEARAVVITGAGNHAFCAGADVKELAGASPDDAKEIVKLCLLYTSPSPRDRQKSRMPSSA